MKTSAIARIVIFSLVIFLLVGILAIAVLGYMFGFYFSKEALDGGTIANHSSVKAHKIRNIEIDWVSGSVTIKTGDTDTIAFSETGSNAKKNTMVWKQSGDTLEIQFRPTRKFFGISIGDENPKDLTITIPKDWGGNELSIDSVSAKINVPEINVKTLDFKTVSGSIDLTGSVTDVELDSASADCTLNLMAGVKSIDMNCISGKLTVYLPEEQGFIAEIAGTSDIADIVGINGEINTDFPVSTSNGKYVYGDGSCNIDAGCIAGEIIIKKAP